MEHRYGSAPDQFGRLFLPDGAGPHPVCVVLHGGFWREPYGLELEDAVCADLAAHGIAAWNLEYRRVGPRSRGGWPATFEDVAAGVDALGTVAAGAQLDLGRVTAAGHSAGGHLALWAAARPRLPDGAPGAGPAVAIGAVVSQAGVADLAEARRLGLSRGAVDELLGGDASRLPLASPAALLPLGVPQLLVHGDADGDVPISLARRYAAEAHAAGDDVELVEYAGDHYEHLDPTTGAWERARSWLCEKSGISPA